MTLETKKLACKSGRAFDSLRESPNTGTKLKMRFIRCRKSTSFTNLFDSWSWYVDEKADSRKKKVVVRDESIGRDGVQG